MHSRFSRSQKAGFLRFSTIALFKRCDCYRQRWAILMRPVFILSPNRAGATLIWKVRGGWRNFEKNHNELLWFCGRDVTIFSNNTFTITPCHFLFNSRSKRYCRSLHCSPLEAKQPEKYKNHFLNPWKVRPARRTVWLASWPRSNSSVCKAGNSLNRTADTFLASTWEKILYPDYVQPRNACLSW